MLTLSPSKLHSLLLELNNHPVDVMLLCETWHDADLVAIRRLRAEGYSVVERARPRTRRADESLGVNHTALPSSQPLAYVCHQSTSGDNRRPSSA